VVFMDKVFGKWDSNVKVNDPGLKRYINLDPRYVYHTQGKQASIKFGKSKVHIVERLVNTLMRGGTGRKIGGKIIRDRKGCGKKAKMYRIVEEAFDEIYKRTKKNPLQLLVQAIENAAPREETTRVKYGGIINLIPVDISPQRRVDLALRNIGKAVAMRSFDSKKSAKNALVEEIILASNNDPQSHAVSRKIEIERMAKSSR